MEGPEREYSPEPPEDTCEECADTDKGHGGSVGFSWVRDPILQEIIPPLYRDRSQHRYCTRRGGMPKTMQESRRPAANIIATMSLPERMPDSSASLKPSSVWGIGCARDPLLKVR